MNIYWEPVIGAGGRNLGGGISLFLRSSAPGDPDNRVVGANTTVFKNSLSGTWLTMNLLEEAAQRGEVWTGQFWAMSQSVKFGLTGEKVRDGMGNQAGVYNKETISDKKFKPVRNFKRIGGQLCSEWKFWEHYLVAMYS